MSKPGTSGWGMFFGPRAPAALALGGALAVAGLLWLHGKREVETRARAPAGGKGTRSSPTAPGPVAGSEILVTGDDVLLRTAIAAGDAASVDRVLMERLRHGFLSALASLDRLPGADGSRTDDLCCRLVQLWVRSAPASARSELLAAYGATLPPAIVAACYGTLATLQPSETLAAQIVALPPGAEQRGAAAELVRCWAGEAPEAAFAWCRSHRDILDDTAVENLVTAAGRSDPRAAVEFLIEQAGTFQNSIRWEMQMSDAVARSATGRDALQWLEWAAAQPLGVTAWNNVVKQVSARLRETEPATALGLAMEIQDPHLRDELLSASARADWVVDYGARHGALGLAALFDDPVHQSAAVARCVEGWSAVAPDTAARLVAELPAGALRNAAIQAAVVTLAHDYPEVAAALLQQVSGPAEMRRELVAEMLAAVDRVAPGGTAGDLGRRYGAGR